MSSRSRKIVIWCAVAIAAAALVVLSALTVSAVALPGCEACHGKGDFGRDTASSPHSSVECIACHVEMSVTGRASFAVRQVFHMVVPVVRTVDRSFSAVPRERCLRCHADIEKAGVSEARGLRIEHSKCAPASQCSECHSITAHGASTRWPRTAQMESCYSCHGKTNKVTKCDTCHADRDQRQLISSGSFRVTHGPEWKTTHGMGDMRSCAACHDEQKCGSCHGAGVPHAGDFLSNHSDFSTSRDARCTSCHLKQFCSDCHAYPMPHSAAFTVGHRKTVEKDGEKKCLTCHDRGDCVQCHEDHVHPVTQEQMDGFMLKRTHPGDE